MTDNPYARLSEEELRRRRSVKWRRYPEDVLPLWVAEMDVLLAEPVVEVLTEAIALGDTGYLHGTEYAEALAGFAARRWGWWFPPAAARLVPDVMIGITEVLKVVTGPGDTVLINTPVYPPFFSYLRHLERRIRRVPLGADDRLDLAALDRAFAEARAGGGAALLLCSPHNPTGTVHDLEELTALAALAAEHGVRLVADEIHGPLTHRGTAFRPLAGVPGAERAIAVTSAAKGWNLSGVKAALAVPGPEAVTDLARMPDEVGYGASHFGVIAHTAALERGEPWLDDHLAGLRANGELLAAAVAERLPGVRWRRGAATYLAWLDCTALGLGPDPAQVFLERGRVALNSGLTFGPGGEHHVRLNYATSPVILSEAVERMARTVGG